MRRESFPDLLTPLAQKILVVKVLVLDVCVVDVVVMLFFLLSAAGVRRPKAFTPKGETDFDLGGISSSKMRKAMCK